VHARIDIRTDVLTDSAMVSRRASGMTQSVRLDGDEATLRTVEKALTMLEELASAAWPGIGVGDLGRRLGLHRTTQSRFLATLARRGYVEPIQGTDRYRVGLKALELASAPLRGLPLREIGAPILEQLNRSTRETVHIVVLDGGEVVTIDRLEAERPITLRSDIGSRRPAYCSAAGKAMLAHRPETEVDELLARGMPARTATTITTPLRLKAQLQEIRMRGYALDDEENVEGVRCAAAPVFELTGRLAGAVSLAAPTYRVDVPRLLELAVPVIEAAHSLSRQLGYRIDGSSRFQNTVTATQSPPLPSGAAGTRARRNRTRHSRATQEGMNGMSDTS
jgi:IclR family acetate operon transcriptional repressor